MFQIQFGAMVICIVFTTNLRHRPRVFKKKMYSLPDTIYFFWFWTRIGHECRQLSILKIISWKIGTLFVWVFWFFFLYKYMYTLQHQKNKMKKPQMFARHQDICKGCLRLIYIYIYIYIHTHKHIHTRTHTHPNYLN